MSLSLFKDGYLRTICLHVNLLLVIKLDLELNNL